MTKHLLTLFLLLFFSGTYAQDKVLKGILEDNGEALLFATVSTYRDGILLHGTETDLKGKYEILCRVGDTLEFSYIGYKSSSIIVTEAMFSDPSNFPRIRVERIKSKAFKQEMKARLLKLEESLNYDSLSTGKKGRLSNIYALNPQIVDFSLVDGVLLVDKKVPDSKYTLSITQKIGIQLVAPWHQYKIQNKYAQGRPINGVPTYQDYSDGESHSFGPKISTLESQGIESQNNSLYESGITYSTNATFKAERSNKKIYGLLNHKRSPDIFNQYHNSNVNLRLGWIKHFHDWRDKDYFNVEFNLNRAALENHNYTGYYHNVLQSMLVQSPSFESKNQLNKPIKSYSPNFQNPKKILTSSSNPLLYNVASAFMHHKWRSKNNYTNLSNVFRIELKKANISEIYNESLDGSEQSTISTFKVKSPTIQLNTHFKHNIWQFEHEIFELTNVVKVAKADFSEFKNDQELYNRRAYLFRNSITPKLNIKIDNSKLLISINSLFSNNQPISLFNLNISGNHLFYFQNKKIDKLTLYTSGRRVTKEQDLILDRYNYSSFLLNHYQLQEQRLNVPLWLPGDLQNEVKDEFEIGLIADKRYSTSNFATSLAYNYIAQKNVIFPVLENDRFILKNATDFTTHKISWVTRWKGSKTILDSNIGYKYSLEINHLTSKVNKVHIPNDKVSIAGFSDISKELIIGQPVGVIVGSDYNRNENGEVIIAENGFPTRAETNKIIGDPTPLFNYIYELELNHKNIFLKFIIDGQIGGKVWNGTQQTLDYYGVSQNSADQREITNYIFEGVKADGTINDIEVSIADPNNGLSSYFWTRYGEEGIASEYIQNASHISLKSITLSYWQKRHNRSNIKVSFFAKNLLTIGSFPGFTTSNLYEDSISYGLQYFNQPITTEIGTSLTYIF